MERVSVSSSDLAAIGYDEGSKVLEVEFKHGGVYQYLNVPTTEHISLMNAGSHGKYFSANIRSGYEYQKL